MGCLFTKESPVMVRDDIRHQFLNGKYWYYLLGNNLYDDDDDVISWPGTWGIRIVEHLNGIITRPPGIYFQWANDVVNDIVLLSPFTPIQKKLFEESRFTILKYYMKRNLKRNRKWFDDRKVKIIEPLLHETHLTKLIKDFL